MRPLRCLHVIATRTAHTSHLTHGTAQALKTTHLVNTTPGSRVCVCVCVCVCGDFWKVGLNEWTPFRDPRTLPCDAPLSWCHQPPMAFPPQSSRQHHAHCTLHAVESFNHQKATEKRHTTKAWKITRRAGMLLRTASACWPPNGQRWRLSVFLRRLPPCPASPSPGGLRLCGPFVVSLSDS